jgi:hypothetical protein
VKAGTLIPGIPVLSDSILTNYIERAQDLLDSYFGKFEHHMEDDDTDFVFPRVKDEDESGVPVIPPQVKKATLRIVEYLFLKGNPSSASEMEGVMQSESMSASGFSYNRGNASQSLSASRESILPAEAKILLEVLKQKTFSLSVE